MKRKLLSAFAVGLPIVLFIVTWRAASWRPHNFGQVWNGQCELQLSPDGRWLIISGLDPTLRAQLWDLQHLSKNRDLPPAYFYRFSRDSQFLASVGQRVQNHDKEWKAGPNSAIIEEIQSGHPVSIVGKRFFLAPPAVLDAAFSPDGKQFRILTRDALRLFNAHTGHLIGQRGLRTRFVDSEFYQPHRRSEARFSPDGAYILMWNKARRLLNAENGNLRHTFPNHGMSRDRVDWSPDGQLCVFYSSPTTTCEIFRASDGGWIPGIFPRWGQTGFVFGPDSRSYLLSGFHGAQLHSIPSQAVIQTLPEPLKRPFQLAPDGSFAISCDSKGQLLRWRLK